MEHLAIMRKSWKLTQKILTGQKKIELRWYKVRYFPWNKIRSDDIIYFKDSADSVSIKAEVEKIIQFSNLTPEKVKQILVSMDLTTELKRMKFQNSSRYLKTKNIAY